LTEPVDILKKYWGYDAFRPLQEDIIKSVLEGADTLALLPTGGGKSICFQVPGLMLEGVCLVVSPLIALMKDQVQQLQKRNIKAVALYAGMSKREIDITLDNIAYGAYKFVYVSPERLQSELFRARAEKMNISLLAIDEAHCISQWGYDFRPPYLEIANFKEEFGVEKIIALTATATPEVRKDITEKLGMSQPKIFTKSFARFNLSYSVFQLESKLEKCLQILQNVPGSSVVYVRTRKRTKEIAQELGRRGLSVDFYHAGLTPVERSTKQEKWIKGQIRVIVSTNAFGMGIDKPDVRSVIHMDLPDTLEAYYQEAGRAGRDERKAYAVMLYRPSDIDDLKRRIEESHVDLAMIRRVYQSLANYYKLAVGSGLNSTFEFHHQQLIKNFDLPTVSTFHALKKLEDEGLIQISEGFYQPSRLICLLTHDDLYKFQVANSAYDPIIKSILRLYGGEIYNDYVEIRESDIAHMTNLSKKVVHERLEMMAKYEVIDYQSSSAAPHITFTTPRLDANSLPVDKEMIAWRKDVALQKAAKVLAYLESDTQCRTRLLQAYFGEESEEDCGICDYCVEKRKREKGELHEPGELIYFIPEGGIALDQLVRKSSMVRQDVINLLRELLDQSKISFDSETEWVSLNK
jgi:ATP-dependent DNA helicase RecQ